MSERTRREFMGAAAVGLGMLPLMPYATLASEATMSMEQFQSMERTMFYFAPVPGSGSGAGKVKLLKVRKSAHSPGLSQFHLKLRGRRGVRLSEGTYRVENWDGHPYFELHVKPTGVDGKDRERYVAEFALLDD